MSDISVPIADLRVGHYVKLPLSWKQHPFLFSSFRIKDEAQLQIIRNIGLYEVVVDPDKSTVEIVITPAISEEVSVEPEIEQKPDPQKIEQQQMRRSIRTAERAFTNSVSPLRESLSQLNLKPDEGLGTVAELVRNAGLHLSQQEGPVGFHLVRIANQADSLLLHSLNVAFIAMLIAKEAGWNALEIEDAGLAGLVHDIGEIKIPNQITRKRTELSKAEINYLRMHVQYGYEQLTTLNAFSVKVRLAAYQHHERLDGSGYPQGLKAEQLDPLSRLIAVVDSYDEQLNPRNATRPGIPNQIISNLFKRANKQLDNGFIQILIKVMGIYPPGSLVLLSDDTPALVMSSEPGAPLKPCILPFTKGRVQEGVELINLKNDERTISKVVDYEELTPPQREFFNLGKHYCYYFSTFSPAETLSPIPT
jgi:HD-GYP domain-containing protein (c-di-GMP phosphodiesterase class II)